MNGDDVFVFRGDFIYFDFIKYQIRFISINVILISPFPADSIRLINAGLMLVHHHVAPAFNQH